MEEDDQKLLVRLVGRNGRRRYDPASKDRLVSACLEPSVSVSRLALEHGVNANLLRKWIKKGTETQSRVVIANPILVRAIAWAKVKTDKIDAAVLAKLHASGFLPEVWMPDEETETRRRVVAERTQLVSQMTRLKNRIHSVLHANLIPPYKGTLFSKRGRAWLEAQPLAEDQRRVVLRHAGELDRLGGELAQVDKSLAQTALQEPRVKRLMTITGVNVTVALSIVAAIGDVERFSSPEKLVSYFGLNPRVRQSGDKPAYHGRITKQGRAHARSMLVEAAWVISGVPGPLRAFFMRIRDKRGKHVAAVATARKLAVIVWHMLTKDENYIWSRSALLDWKLRKLELTAGYPSHRGGRAKESAADYSNKSVRESERETIGNAEEVYRRFVATWKQQSPKGRSGAAHEVRRS
ncbi:IS110 family transposase [Mesorhizobium huakuii]|uniref:IS110 family transposase n=1 Tax=Mesorhizobium huakuii TaxID=28104 RepID=UPI00161D31FE|nr:IS110 family transposase [Mesorhizobium huakuii]